MKRPPGPARRLLARLLPASCRDSVIGDLHEMSTSRSRLWFWKQLAAAALQLRLEQLREVTGLSWSFLKWLSRSDLTIAVRMHRRSPGLTLLAILALGIGIAMCSSGFSLLNALRDSELPAPGADRIVRLRDDNVRRNFEALVPADELARRMGRLQSYESLGAYYTAGVHLRQDELSLSGVRAAFITPNGLEIAAARPVRGRLFNAADLRTDPPPVLLGHQLWQTRFGGNAAIVGQRLEVSGQTREIIGVLAPGFRFPSSHDLWMPAEVDPARGGDPQTRFRAFGRLREGVSLAAASAELDAVASPQTLSYPDRAEMRFWVTPYTHFFEPGFDALLMAVTVGLVLLLVVFAANVATLLLARNAGRTGEIAVRTALGAGRGRILGQLFIEALLLGAAAAVLGVVTSQLAFAWLLRVTDNDWPYWLDLSLDWKLLAFVGGVTLLASAVAGLAPAVKATRVSPIEALQSLGRGAAGLRFGRLSGLLIAVEIAIALGLLAAAVPLARGLIGYSFRDDGLPRDRLIVAQVYFGQPDLPPGVTRIDGETWKSFLSGLDGRLDALEAGLAAVAGVESVSTSLHFPGNELDTSFVEIEDAASGVVPARTRQIVVGPRFFETLETSPLTGRLFGDADFGSDPRPVIVNRAFAERFFAGEQPVGKRLRLVPSEPTESSPWREVVGVVGDLGVNPGDTARSDALYVPLDGSNALRLGVLFQDAAAASVPTVEETIHRVDPEVDVQGVRTLEAMAADQVNFLAGASTGFVAAGLVALVLSLAGVYAMLSLAVTQRTREIGIRMALGSSRTGVLSSVLRRGLLQVLLGTVLGLGVAAATTRALIVLPFDVPEMGPGPLVLLAVALIVVSLSACIVPARRALALQPRDALRAD